MALGVNSHWAPQTQVWQVIFKVFFILLTHLIIGICVTVCKMVWLPGRKFFRMILWFNRSIEHGMSLAGEQMTMDETATWICVISTVFLIWNRTERVNFFSSTMAPPKKCYPKFKKKMNSQIFSEVGSSNYCYQNNPIKETENYKNMCF